MRDSHLDWIWSRYRTSPDASSGMQSLYRTCSVFTELVLQPSHIILRGGGFTLHPELAIPLTDIVTSMDRLLLLAAKHNRLPQAPYIGRQELSILTASESLHSCATQNQIVFNWVLLIDRLALAMRELQWLCIGDDPTRHGWTSWMPGILASLPPSLRIKLPRDFLESYGITVLPPAANTSEAVNQTAAALRHAEVVSCRLTGRSHVALDDVEAEGFAVAARSPNSSSAVAKATEDLAHLDRATSMSNLIDRFTRYPTPAISLLARTTCIVKSKSLSSVEITDRGIDSALGRFALEIGFFRRVNDATNAMQSILTEASSLARIRDKCFVVDPHGALMRMLRGTNTTGELQAAWRSLSERMYVSQGRLAEYEHYGEKAGNTPANERHESAPQLPVPTSARSRLVPSNVTDIEVICPRGSRVESHESQAPAHIDGSAALPIVSRTVVELGGLHVEMGETLARVSIVKREELHGRIAELHTTTGGRNLEQVSALDIQVADAKGGHILVPVLERGGLDADTCENQQTKYSPEEQRTLATQPSVGQAHPVILLYTSSSRLRLTLSRSFVVDSKAFALVSAIVRPKSESYLACSHRGELAPYLAWEREGIGTAPWIC
ncbi:hypothetical protein DFH06DRAFT_1132229 [Mycena polygramma]|nr:hypothetical protein DFH06DRAFT_1132229 [Mycena polygramma]